MLEGNPYLDRLEELAVWPRGPRDYPLTRFVAGDALRPLDALHVYHWSVANGKTMPRASGTRSA
jgi:hypothetical protein